MIALKDAPPHIRLLAKFLRAFFHLLYHQFAWTYDWVAATVSVGMWKDWVRAALPDLHGPRVLEVGHGPGHLQAALAEAGHAAFGLDESMQMSTQAGKRVAGAGWAPRLANGLAQQMPFAPASFHQVAATFPAEYIVDPRTLSEVFRVLLPGGSFIILAGAEITGKGILEQGAAWLFRVTAQAGNQDASLPAQFLAAFRKVGFAVDVERRVLDSSVLIFVHARKPGERDR